MTAEVQGVESQDEHDLLVSLCRDFVSGVIRPHIDRYRDQPETQPLGSGVWSTIQERADSIGLRALGVPEAFGGIELGAGVRVRCIEELARGDLGFAMNLVQDWALTSLVAACAPSIRDEWLARYLATADLALATCPDQLGRAIAGSEGKREGRDSDIEGLSATRSDAGWRVDGVVDGIRNAERARWLVLAVELLEPASGDVPAGIALVSAEAAGVSVADGEAQVGQEAGEGASVTLEGVHVPDRYLMRDGLGDGVGDYARSVALLEAAGALGVAQGAFDASARYVQERPQGGQLIISFPAVARVIAAMATELETIRALTYRAAWAQDQERSEAAALALMARMHAPEAALSITRSAIDVHGGSGVMREMGVERYYRDVLALRNGVWRDAPAYALVKALLPASPVGFGGPESSFDLVTE